MPGPYRVTVEMTIAPEDWSATIRQSWLRSRDGHEYVVETGRFTVDWSYPDHLQALQRAMLLLEPGRRVVLTVEED